MREILFRGKWIGNGEWVEGHYCKISETTYAFAEDYERNPIPVHHYILHETMTDWGLPNRFNQYEIDPETLCQCTGKTDEDGKKIFEGDIVGFDDIYSTESGYSESSCLGEVVWSAEECCFYVTNRLSAESWEVLDECKVVGNVFDNPELIEEQ